MLTAKKLLRILLCIQILTTYHYTVPITSGAQSTDNIARLTTKAKDIIMLMHEFAEEQDWTADLESMYRAIQQDRRIVARSQVDAAMNSVFLFLKKQQQFFKNKKEFDLVINYIKDYLDKLQKTPTPLDITTKKSADKNKKNFAKTSNERFVAALKNLHNCMSTHCQKNCDNENEKCNFSCEPQCKTGPRGERGPRGRRGEVGP